MEHLTRPDHLMPSTFEERGASVPFTTPALMGARLRKDDFERLELLIPGFSGGAGTLVVPWPSVPQVVSLTLHDTMLQEEVTLTRAADPHTVRLTALRIAADGFAGPEACIAAQKALKDDEVSCTFANLLLIASVIENGGQPKVSLLMQEIATPEGQQRTRGRLIGAANRSAIGIETLDRRLEELSKLVGPIGLAWGLGEGRGRLILTKLKAFRKSLAEWAQRNSGDIAGAAWFASEVADYTIEVGDSVLHRFDTEMAQLMGVIVGWAKRRPELVRLAGRLMWLLDGWEALGELWQAAQSKTLGDQITTLQMIMTVLPMVPRDELPEARLNRVDDLVLSSRRWVRANVNWRTGQPDAEMVRRLEAMKAHLS